MKYTSILLKISNLIYRTSLKGYAGMYLKKKNLGFSKNKSLEKAVFAGNPEYIF